MNRLLSSSLYLLAGTLITQVGSAFAYWIVARRIEPGEFGGIVAFVGVAFAVASFADLGVNLHTTRLMARGSDPGRAAFRMTLGAKLAVGGTLGLIWAIACLTMAMREVSWGGVAVWLGPFITASVAARTLEVPFRARLEMRPLAVCAAVERVVVTSVAVVLTTMGHPFLALPAALSTGACVVALALWLRLDPAERAIGAVRPSGVWRLFRDSAAFGASALFIHAQRFDVALVSAIAGPTAAGLFAAPARVTGLLGSIPLALTAAIFPSVASSTDDEGRRQRPLAAIKVSFIIVLPVLAVVFIMAPTFTTWLLGESYTQSGDVLRVVVISLLPASFNGPLSAVLQAQGRERRVALILGISISIGMCFIAVGAAIADAVGAAWGLVALQLAILSMLYQELRRHPDPVAGSQTGDACESLSSDSRAEA